MRIAMVASECEPFAKTGGLADVVDALSRALGQLGHEVDVYLPRYRGLNPPGPVETLRVEVPTADGEAVPVEVVSSDARGYRLRLVDHPPSYDRTGYYTEHGADYPDNGWRFTLLGRAALETMRAEGRPADVIHAHDWEGAPAILLLRHRYEDTTALGRPATMLTCHNLAYHGWVPRSEVWAQLDLPDHVGNPEGVNLLMEGILHADIVNTVSPTYAQESLTPEYGSGLDQVLRYRGDRYIGIINGIDADLWNPATDREIEATYSAADLTGKAACRDALVTEMGLDPDRPIFAMVSRLDPMKGFDLVASAAYEILDAGASIAILGTGHRSLIDGLRPVAEQFPTRLAIEERFDRGLARRMYAGADAFLMPSRFEPCGQGQMIAMRYGTVPIVRATGGLADTVIDADHDAVNGNGFSFGDPHPDYLADACRRALAALADGPRWQAIQNRGMTDDWSWRGPARDYLAAYRRAIELSPRAFARPPG
jgi:starch synthase